MTGLRRNSVVIDFNVMPVRPDINSVTTFIKQVLKVDIQRMRNIQFNNCRNHIIVELQTPEEADELANKHNLKHKVGYRGQGYRIPIFIEDNAIQVRVHDLPPYMPNELIVAHLEAYGEVKSIRDEVWREHFPGIPNGVRAVRMVLVRPIPSFITIGSESAYITYKSQQHTCRHCAEPLHRGIKCVEAKTQTPSFKPSPTPPAPKNQQEHTKLPNEDYEKALEISSDEDNNNGSSPQATEKANNNDNGAAETAAEAESKNSENKQNANGVTGGTVGNNNKRSGSPTLDKKNPKRKENIGQPSPFFRKYDKN